MRKLDGSIDWTMIGLTTTLAVCVGGIAGLLAWALVR